MLDLNHTLKICMLYMSNKTHRILQTYEMLKMCAMCVMNKVCHFRLIILPHENIVPPKKLVSLLNLNGFS